MWKYFRLMNSIEVNMESLLLLSLDLNKVIEELEKCEYEKIGEHLHRGFNEVCRRIGARLAEAKYIRLSYGRGCWGAVKLFAEASYTGYNWLRKDVEVAVAIATLLDYTHDVFYDEALKAIIANILQSLYEPEWEVEPEGC